MGDTREIHGRYTGGMREIWRLALERGVVEALGQRRRLGGPRVQEGRPRGSSALYLPCSSAALLQHEQRELHLRGLGEIYREISRRCRGDVGRYGQSELHLRGQAGAPRRRRSGQRRAWLGVGVGLGLDFGFGSG